MNRLRFCLNGRWVEETHLSPTTTLLRYLRESRALVGTKEGCAEGDCGACTVAVAERGDDGKAHWRAINSCLLLLPMVQGKHVVTVEALKDPSTGEPHPAQEAMASALGSQCGYCTPGIVMSMFEATYRTDLDAPWKLDDQLCGNLCRCTGYRPIRDAAHQIAGSCPKDRFALELKDAMPQSMRLDYQTDGQHFFIPDSFSSLWDVLDAHPDARFVQGGTDLSLEITKRFARPPKLVGLEGVPELKAVHETVDGFSLGAAATLAEVERFCEKRIHPISRMVRYFGARQIKHRATVGGNLCTASPIGDLAPVLLSLGATAVMRSRSGERRIPLEAFFTGYRKTVLAPKELLCAVEIPRIPSGALACAYKVSKRRELDISTVAAGLFVERDSHGTVLRARLGFGGMAATPKRASAVEAALIGKKWDEATLEQAITKLPVDFQPLSDHRGSSAYRALVAANFLRGFYEETKLIAIPRLAERHTGTIGTHG
jgi:xanthine dehydrogenase small subunit